MKEFRFDEFNSEDGATEMAGEFLLEMGKLVRSMFRFVARVHREQLYVLGFRSFFVVFSFKCLSCDSGLFLLLLLLIVVVVNDSCCFGLRRPGKLAIDALFH